MEKIHRSSLVRVPKRLEGTSFLNKVLMYGSFLFCCIGMAILTRGNAFERLSSTITRISNIRYGIYKDTESLWVNMTTTDITDNQISLMQKLFQFIEVSYLIICTIFIWKCPSMVRNFSLMIGSLIVVCFGALTMLDARSKFRNYERMNVTDGNFVMEEIRYDQFQRKMNKLPDLSTDLTKLNR